MNVDNAAVRNILYCASFIVVILLAGLSTDSDAANAEIAPSLADDQIAVIVNDEIITQADIEQRMALAIIANHGTLTAEERERLPMRMQRNLIDEALKMQAARAEQIVVTDAEVDEVYAQFARIRDFTPESFTRFLADNHSSKRSIQRQIRSELAWDRLRRRQWSIDIGKGEAKRHVDMTGETEVRIGEIYLSATAETKNSVLKNGRRIVEEIRQGGSFQAYARKFSEATHSEDIGWIRASQLPDGLGPPIRTLKIGEITGPIEIPGGFSIIHLLDQRQVQDPNHTILNLRQISISFPKGMATKRATARAAAFARATRTIRSCNDATKIAKTLGAKVADNDRVPVENLPPHIREMLDNTQLGQATLPFGSQEEGMRALLLCGRRQVSVEPDITDAPDLERRRIQLKHLSDLQANAIIVYY